MGHYDEQREADMEARRALDQKIREFSAPPSPEDILPSDDKERAMMPIVTGCLDYFPNALAYVAFISKHGSLKHNPGEEMHWARNKSTDHADKIGRHLVERGKFYDDAGTKLRHSGNLAWRALALLQTELEEAGICPRARASR